MHPNDPLRAAEANAAASDPWHGKCFLYDHELQLRHEVTFKAATAPTRVVTAKETPVTAEDFDPDGNPVGPIPSIEFDTWLLIGSPAKVPFERHWSALYQLEMEDV